MQSAITSPENVDARDFPDWLNPIVVKELRQGLRQMPFMLVFLLAHGILASAYLMAFDALRTGGEVNPGAGAIISGVIFTSFAAFGIFLQPLRALFTISAETKTDSLDLLRLTKLDSAKIFIGKWFALFSQTLLMAVSLLPYLVLRYHLGGMSLFAELSTFYWMLMASGIITAVAVSASVAVSKLSMFTLPVVAGYFLLLTFSILGRSSSTEAALKGDATAPGFYAAFLALTLVGVAAIRLALHAGAAQISASHEMGSARVRKAGLGLLLFLLLLPGWPPVDRALTASLFSFILLAATFVEPPVISTAMARTYLENGWRGRWAARFLLPGWAHGGLFASLVLFTHFAAMTLLRAEWSPFRSPFGVGQAIACIILPVLPFFPIFIVAMREKGDRDVLSRVSNPFLLLACLFPAGFLMLASPVAVGSLIGLAAIYFIVCLLFGLMTQDYRHPTHFAVALRHYRDFN
ncbi:MAG: hypothetical protein ACKO2G_12385 [Verrucomicrobiales bacterium]